MLKRLLQEPLLHFLLAAALIFLIGAYRGDNQDSNIILVNDSVLSRYLLNRTPSLNASSAQQQILKMSDDERRGLTDDFIAQEILYREAKSLGLDEQDHTLRRGLIQKMETLLTSFNSEESPPTDKELLLHYQHNLEKYSRPASVSFKHLFFKNSASVQHRIQETLTRLQNGESILGVDLFPYQRAYLDSNISNISSHFGVTFASTLFDLEPKANVWQGPVSSSYGVHLVNLTSKHNGGVLPFERVSARVHRDYLRNQQFKKRKQVLQSLAKNYRIIHKP